MSLLGWAGKTLKLDHQRRFRDNAGARKGWRWWKGVGWEERLSSGPRKPRFGVFSHRLNEQAHLGDNRCFSHLHVVKNCRSSCLSTDSDAEDWGWALLISPYTLHDSAAEGWEPILARS